MINRQPVDGFWGLCECISHDLAAFVRPPLGTVIQREWCRLWDGICFLWLHRKSCSKPVHPLILSCGDVYSRQRWNRCRLRWSSLLAVFRTHAHVWISAPRFNPNHHNARPSTLTRCVHRHSRQILEVLLMFLRLCSRFSSRTYKRFPSCRAFSLILFGMMISSFLSRHHARFCCTHTQPLALSEHQQSYLSQG